MKTQSQDHHGDAETRGLGINRVLVLLGALVLMQQPAAALGVPAPAGSVLHERSVEGQGNGESIAYNLASAGASPSSNPVSQQVEVPHALDEQSDDTGICPMRVYQSGTEGSPATGQTSYVECKSDLEGDTGARDTADPLDVPPAPLLLSPANNSTLDTLIPITNIDARLDGVQISPRIEISTDATFQSIDDWVTYCGWTQRYYEHRLFTNLQANTRYFWRARTAFGNACGDPSPDWGPSSPIWSFYLTSEGTVLPGPPLDSPLNGSTVYGLRPTLRWQNTPGSVGFITWIRDVTLNRTLGTCYSWDSLQTSCTWFRDLTVGHTYEWWVQNKNEYAWGRESNHWRFTVRLANIYGRVSGADGDGLAGVTVSDNAGHSATSDSDGFYTLTGLASGIYTIMPNRSGYIFCPNQRRVNVSSSVSGQNFTGFDADVMLGLCPNPDGYQFSNDDSGWGSFPFSAYDYGYDELIRMFGQDNVCLMMGSTCLVKPQADLWHLQANAAMNGGHCDGMASTSLRFFKGLDLPASFNPDATTPHELGLSDVRRHVAYYFVEQLTDPVQAYKNQIRQNSPSIVLDQLRAAMQNGAPDPATLFIRPMGEDGHTITPFAIEDRGNGVSWVRVYDNKHPDDVNHFVVINTTDQTWSYDLGWTTWAGDANTHTLGIVPISQYAEQPVCPWCDGSLEMAEPDNSPMQEIWLNGSGHLLVTDAQWRRLGYTGTQFHSEIPGAYAGFVDGGLGIEMEPIYKLPVSDGYTILLDGQTVSLPEDVTVAQFGPGYAAQVDNIRLQPSVRDTIAVSADGSQIAYQPNENRTPSLVLAVDDGAASYELKLANVEVDANQRVTAVAQGTTGRLAYSNALASGGEYDLFVRRVSSSGVQLFAHNALTIAASDTHYADYRNWNGLESMTLQIDHGSNGTIDETLTLQNQIRSVSLPIVLGN